MLLALTMLISGIYAYGTISKTETKQSMKISAVNIDLQEYTLKNGQEEAYGQSTQYYVPGGDISFIPRVFNYGEKCYLRVKLEFDSNGLGFLTKEDIIGMNGNLKEYGDYFYYLPPLEENSNIDIFEGFNIPTSLDNTYQDLSLNFKITIDAIQYKHFYPDYDSDFPWGDVVIEKCIEEDYNINFDQENSIVEIIYENGAEKYVTIPDNFFGGINRLLPGDSESQDIYINNTSSKKLDFYFRTEVPDEQDQRKLELLKAIQLKISLNNTTLYEGNLYTTKEYFLGTFSSNQIAKMNFEFAIPLTLNNAYSIEHGKLMNWYFSVRDNPAENNKPIETSDKITVAQTQPPDTEITQQSKNPFTGDNIEISLIIFFTSAIGLVVVMIKYNKNKKILKRKRRF